MNCARRSQPEDAAVPAAPPAERIEEHLSVLEAVVDHMASLVEICSASSAWAAVRCPGTRAGSGADVLREVVAAQWSRSEQNGIPIVTVLPGEDWSVCVDRRRLTQALSNLVAVAIEDSAPGGTVTISARRKEAGCVELAVQGGYGVSEGDVTRVFEPFFRPSEGGNDSVSLGLAIAKEIVELHGGTIALEGIPGEGSRFLVSLNILDGCSQVQEMTELSNAVESGPHD